MNDSFTFMLGIAKKGGKLTAGFGEVERSITNGHSHLIIFTSDIAPRTEKNIKFLIQDKDIKIRKIPYTKDDVRQATGKWAAVLSINNRGMAEELFKREIPREQMNAESVSDVSDDNCNREE